jgi:selenide,water dikinase
VTGFGLIGHAAGMIEGSHTGLLIQSSDLPIFDEVAKYSAKGLLPGGLQRNRKFRDSIVQIDESVPQYLQDVLFDPQTSGGLLISVPAEQASEFVESLLQAGISRAVVIGEIVPEPAGKIVVR